MVRRLRATRARADVVFLEKRVEAESGKVAFAILRRTDNLYQFRIDRLRPAMDDCEAYWIEGYQLSGLYQTAGEAETAVRASVEWRDAQQQADVAPTRSAPPPPPTLTNFFRVWTDPYGKIRSQETLDWQMSRAGNRAGPFVAPHLPELGIKYTSLASGFARDAPPDQIVYKLNPGRPVRDFESGSAFWIVSESTRDVLQRYAADSIDFVPAQVFQRGKDGKDIETPPRFLCDVIRFEDAVDEATSKIQWGPGKQHGVGSLFAFKSDLPANLHLFRLWKSPNTIVCSAELRHAIEAAKLSGVAFGRLDILEYD